MTLDFCLSKDNGLSFRQFSSFFFRKISKPRLSSVFFVCQVTKRLNKDRPT